MADKELFLHARKKTHTHTQESTLHRRTHVFTCIYQDEVNKCNTREVYLGSPKARRSWVLTLAGDRTSHFSPRLMQERHSEKSLRASVGQIRHFVKVWHGENEEGIQTADWKDEMQSCMRTYPNFCWPLCLQAGVYLSLLQIVALMIRSISYNILVNIIPQRSFLTFTV